MAVLYASAYGNTAALAQAISRGVTKAGDGPPLPIDDSLFPGLLLSHAPQNRAIFSCSCR